MKSALKGTLLLIFVTLSALAQDTALKSGKSGPFHWSLRKAHELDYRLSIRSSPGLSPVERAALLKTVEALIRPFMAAEEIASERELRQLAGATRVELVDLDGDRVPEILAQAVGTKTGCGATGNCPFWVFKRVANGYKVLFDSRGPDGVGGFELVTVEPARTSGLNDLVLAGHASASEKSLSVFRFKNGRYRESGCYDANWVSWAGGYHELKNPIITTCGR